ncbi:Heavy metal transport/detoxification superfamily protein [Abeliophyllum distichum]|uniref:Heavy metal transport/detoxification superfamily protein n=1 Tax=Abeliophyllum distichum TaxID=126358 RepID=A0ABD1SXD0_9LAMI
MASISAFSISRPNSHIHLFSYTQSSSYHLSPFQLRFPCVRFQSKIKISANVPASKWRFLRPTKIRSVAEEEETLVPEDEAQQETEASQPPDDATPDQTVSVPVSTSDVLTMFFRAEGAMADSATPTVTKALEEVEGVTDLKVRIIEGIASVELTKQTTVQATGVASNLVEIIQGSGFKLQTLNLSFQDEEDIS